MPTIQEVLRALLGGSRGDIELGKDGELPRIPHEPVRPFSMGYDPVPSRDERGRAAVLSGPEPREHDIELSAKPKASISREAREHWKRQDEDIERRRRADRAPFYGGMPKNRR